MRTRVLLTLVVLVASACSAPPLVGVDAGPDTAPEAANDTGPVDDIAPDGVPPTDVPNDTGMDAAMDAAPDAAQDVPTSDTAMDVPPTDAGPDVRADVVIPADAAPLSPAAPPEVRVTCAPRGTPMVTAGAADRYVLRGRVVTPTSVLAPGEVLVVGNTIACVAASCAGRTGYAGATVINTAGVIYPGLVDAHDHIEYNFLPPWPPPRLFGNHSQWQGTTSYDMFVQPYRDGEAMGHACAMTKYGELRALVAGTTAVNGSSDLRCIRTLVRGLEHGYDFVDAMGAPVDGIRTNVLGISTISGAALTQLQMELASGVTTAYVIHLAEGIDTTARAEFDSLESKMLLTPSTVMIHDTALTPEQFGRVGAAHAAIVWSPRSNVILYGETTNIPAALAAGVRIALAPDWTPSGGPNLLSELRYARNISQTRWGALLSSRDLVEMVTSRAAEVSDRERWIGSLTEGLQADVLVVPDYGCDPYDTLIDTVTADVALVMVGGRPLYGDRAVMNALPASVLANCEDVTYCGIDKRICVSRGPTAADGTNQTLADIDAEIRTFYPTPYPLVPLCP